MYRAFIRKNITTTAIILFIIIFAVIQYLEPAFLYEKDGALRQFGLGSNKKTIIPAAALMAALMLGAIAMHLKVGDEAIKFLPAGIMFVLSSLIIMINKKLS